jgi:hypothetical protein
MPNRARSWFSPTPAWFDGCTPSEGCATSFKAWSHGWTPTLSVWPILFLSVPFIVAALSTAQAADKKIVYGYSFWKANTGVTTEVLTWTDVNAKLKAALASAQQVNIYAGNCHSGGLIAAAADATAGLGMPHIIGTACAAAKTTTCGISRANDTRLKITDQLSSFGYLDYATKRLQGGVPKAKQLHDDAKTAWTADQSYDNNAPDYRRGNNADEDLKLDAGTKASHALVFASDMDGLRNLEAPSECAKAVKALGFTMGSVTDAKTVRYYYSGLTTAGDLYGVHCYGPGTVAKFDAALDTLKARVSADEGKVVVDIFLWGHGAEIPVNARANPDAPPGGPGRGAHVIASAQFDIPMTPDTWADLKEDAVVDRPDWVRASEPRFFLSVSDAHVTQPFSVTLGGIPLGSHTLSGGPAGDLLEVPLDDATINSLTLAHDGDTVLTVGFNLAPNDSMILALEDDITSNPLFQPGLFGTGLELVVSRTVDETGVSLPGTNHRQMLALVLALATAASLVLARRHRYLKALLASRRSGASPDPPT